MSVLLTVFDVSNWKTFVTMTGLPQSNTINMDGNVIIPVQSDSSLNQIIIDSGNTALVAVVQAEHYIVDAMQKGMAIEAAAKEWVGITSNFLKLFRSNRKNIQLFNLHQAMAKPEMFRKITESFVKISSYPAHKIDSSLKLLIASQFVAQNLDIQTLNRLLQVSCLPLCETEVLTIDLKAVDAQASTKEIKADLAKIKEENSLLLSQLHLVQEKLEQYYFSVQDKEKLINEKSKHILSIEKKLKAAETSQSQLGNELLALRNSKAWKLTWPIRVIGRLLNKYRGIQKKLRKDIELISKSKYFDSKWYLQTYPDVAESGVNPAEHYLLYGAAEGRLPSPIFDGNWYLQEYKDVAEAQLNPLLHFIMHGINEGRASLPASRKQN